MNKKRRWKAHRRRKIARLTRQYMLFPRTLGGVLARRAVACRFSQMGVKLPSLRY